MCLVWGCGNKIINAPLFENGDFKKAALIVNQLMETLNK